MSLQRIGIYAGAALLAGLALWFFGGMAIDAVIASRRKEHSAKLEAQVQAKEQDIAETKQQVQVLTNQRDQAVGEAKAAAKEAARLAIEKQAWMKQADELAKRQQAVAEEVARVPDAKLGTAIRAALADIRAGISTSCRIQ